MAVRLTKMKILITSFVMIAIPFTAAAEQYCMNVQPSRIAVIDEALAARNAINAEKDPPVAAMARNEYISQAVKQIAVRDIRENMASDIAINAASLAAAQSEALLAAAKQVNDEIDAKLEGW